MGRSENKNLFVIVLSSNVVTLSHHTLGRKRFRHEMKVYSCVKLLEHSTNDFGYPAI